LSLLAVLLSVALLGCTNGEGNSQDSAAVATRETQTESVSSPVARRSPSPVPAGKWEELSPLPTGRNEVVAASLGGKIFVVGGLIHGRRVDVYDPAEDSWSEAAELPVPLHHTAAAVVADKLYVIGGFVLAWAPTGSVFEYDPSTDQWQEKSPMPTARGGLAATALDGKIYAIGEVKGVGRDNIAALEVYGPASDTWESRSPMQRARDHLAVGVVDGKIYAIGGRLNHSPEFNLSFNEEYDPETDSWSMKAPMPKLGRSGTAAAVLDGRVYVFGGEGSIAYQKDRCLRPCNRLLGADSLDAYPATWPRSSHRRPNDIRRRWRE